MQSLETLHIIESPEKRPVSEVTRQESSPDQSDGPKRSADDLPSPSPKTTDEKSKIAGGIGPFSVRGGSGLSHVCLVAVVHGCGVDFVRVGEPVTVRVVPSEDVPAMREACNVR